MADSRPRKKIKKGHSFYQIRNRVNKHQDLVSRTVENLYSDEWITFCFVKLIRCNAAYSCCFSKAWCVTKRNLDETDESKRAIVRFPSLFDVNLVKQFMNDTDDIESRITDSQLTAFKRLADFLDTIDETERVLKAWMHSAKKESVWATVLAVHVLRKLAVFNEMTIDSDYGYKQKECPCSCGTHINFGDNSIGHKDVWHGSLDILLGPVAVKVAPSDDESSEKSNSAFELETGELEECRNQLISQCITFSYLQNAGLIPLVSLSEHSLKIFLFDPKSDMLYESLELDIFDEFGHISLTAIIVLWLVINHAVFCTGVKDSHEKLGYTSDFKSLVQEENPVLPVYEKDLHRSGLKHVNSTVWKYTALYNIHNHDNLFSLDVFDAE
ncbi:uncharacterized protein LOC123534812 [Mercenaria mercenaria]|uniref:uncharacterized protein LOC123534812 n=1 Tax=Mercenaria mercenaria TaxID=6596 RepID=UPI00234E9D4D|nr:uncharacterized protein LOC123534812 [Mercenaria mercenaria]